MKQNNQKDDDKEFQMFIMTEFTNNGINLYRYCYNNPLGFIDLDGNKAYGIDLEGSIYLLVGVKGKVGLVWDDFGNYGILITVGGGFGAEVSLTTGKGLDKFLEPGLGIMFNDVDTIYELKGYDGMEISASFFLSCTFDDEGNFSGVSGLGMGGSISWGYSVLIPVSDAVDYVKQLIQH